MYINLRTEHEYNKLALELTTNPKCQFHLLQVRFVT